LKNKGGKGGARRKGLSNKQRKGRGKRIVPGLGGTVNFLLPLSKEWEGGATGGMSGKFVACPGENPGCKEAVGKINRPNTLLLKGRGKKEGHLKTSTMKGKSPEKGKRGRRKEKSNNRC